MSTKEAAPAGDDRRRALVGAPANIDEHEEDKALRREEAARKRPKLLDCLDPTQAKYHEDRKTLYEWRIECKIFRAAQKNKPAFMEDFDQKVVSQNENDAWAMFCDKIGEWPSRRDSKPVFTRLKKRTLRDDGDES